jgi:hypothetical protein
VSPFYCFGFKNNNVAFNVFSGFLAKLKWW